MRCIVKDCRNHEHEGQFIGSLCFPCYTYVTTGRGEYSQAFRNAQRTWVGLTADEMEGLYQLATYMDETDYIHMLMMADAKLKEKNCNL